MKEARAKHMADDIAVTLHMTDEKSLSAIMRILKSYGVYKVDPLQNYTCEGQMDITIDFPQFCPDNPEADVEGWAFEERD